MRDDLIKFLAGQKNLSHVFVATFNIDFIFIENVLLRALRKCGHPSLTVFADADEVATTFASQGRWVSRIGRRYRVVPIRMEPGFRFHPKAVMLAGTDNAALFIGSGNLTFGGMRQNDELWLRFESAQDGTGPLAAFKELADACLDRAPFPGPVRAELADAFDPEVHAWSKTIASPSGMLWRVGRGPALLDQLASQVGDLDVRRIVVASPYFDESGEALAAIAARWPRAAIEVLVQSGQSQLLGPAWSRIREPKSLVSVETSRGENAKAFIHAKFYAFLGESDAVLFAGSANCSRAALAIPGSGGNAENLAVVRLKASEVEEMVNSGVTVVDAPAVLQVSLPAVPATEPALAIHILGAHHEHGELVVVFVAPSLSQAIELVADGRTLSGTDVTVAGGVLRSRGLGVISRVQVTATVGGTRLASAEHWVDHEFLLSASSRQRQMSQAIGDHVAPGQWSFQGWTEVLRLLGDHLIHTPEGAARQAQREKADKEKPSTVAATDFFTTEYRLSGQRHDGGRLDEAARVLGLRGLLLDYFGISNDDHAEDKPVDEEDGDDDAVDKPAAVEKKERQSTRPKVKKSLSDAERRRGQRIARQIVDACTSKVFVETRPAAMLSSDLAIVAVLLVSGHAEGWLASEDFLDLTYRVWSFLFFDDGADDKGATRSAGGLERRHDKSETPLQFEDAIRSVRLAAALATWCFCCPKGIAHAETTRFEVATRLAVARLPWLWHLEARDKVERELFEIARRTGWLGPDVADRWIEVVSNWNHLFAEGRALAVFEQTLLQMEMPKLRELVKDDGIAAGTLLWQGPRLGFCTLAQPAKRRTRSDQSVPVLTLRSQNRDAKLSPPYLLPFRTLLRLAAESSPERFTQNHADALAGFATRVESLWASSR